MSQEYQGEFTHHVSPCIVWQVPESRLVNHVLPTPDVASVGATIAEFAQPSKFKLLVVGSRGMGAIRSCASKFISL